MTTTLNGHHDAAQFPAPALYMRGLPPQDGPGHDRAAPDKARREAVDGDKVIRWLTAAVVLAVAAFAAVVSYAHIFELGPAPTARTGRRPGCCRCRWTADRGGVACHAACGA